MRQRLYLNNMKVPYLLISIVLCLSTPANAQLATPNDAGLSFGHVGKDGGPLGVGRFRRQMLGVGRLSLPANRLDDDKSRPHGEQYTESEARQNAAHLACVDTQMTGGNRAGDG